MTELILKYVNIFTFPIIMIFAALIPEFVAVVYTNKWSPAIPAFYAYSVRMIGSNFTTLIIGVLSALGMVKQIIENSDLVDVIGLAARPCVDSLFWVYRNRPRLRRIASSPSPSGWFWN